MRKSPALLQEMINVGCQLTMMANSRGGTFTCVRVFTLLAVKSLFIHFLIVWWRVCQQVSTLLGW